MKRLPRFLIILLALVMIGAACGGDDDDDAGGSGSETETKDPITIGAVFDLSGATSDVGTPYADGIKAYVDYVNGQGGVEGHMINFLNQDYAYKVPQAETLYQQYISQGAVGVIGWGTADSEALKGRVAADKIPYISASYSANLANPAEAPFNFVPGPTYSDQMRVALKYIAEQEKGAQTEVAVFHHDSPFGTSPLDDGKKYVEEEKLKISYKTFAMRAGATDYVAELSQAKGAKYLIIQNVPSPASKLAQNIKSQNLPTQVICLNWCGDELYVQLAGAAAEGTWGVMPFAPPTAETLPADMKEYLEGKGEDPLTKGIRYVTGWNTAKVFFEGVAKAAEGGEKVTGEMIKKELESISGFKTGISPDISFTTDYHAGMKSVPIYKVEGGKWVKVTDALEP